MRARNHSQLTHGLKPITTTITELLKLINTSNRGKHNHDWSVKYLIVNLFNTTYAVEKGMA